jgi:hypothetical protein
MARRLAATAGMAAILSMGVLSACAQKEEPAPEETTTETTTTTTTTTAPPVEPTEKAPRIDPGQPNPFSPTVHAPPAPTAIPGDN